MKFANKKGYTDVTPFEVVEKRTERKLMVREMSCELEKPAELISVGGFGGHYDNHTQQWKISSNADSPVIAIRKNKRGVWKDVHGNHYSLSDRPHKFYDYNF